jgi:hypothetical protein
MHVTVQAFRYNFVGSPKISTGGGLNVGNPGTGADVNYNDNLSTAVPPFTAVSVAEASAGGISLNGQTGPLVTGTFTPTNLIGAPVLSANQQPVLQTTVGASLPQLMVFRDN